MKAKKKGEARFVNPSVKTRSPGNDLLESLHHLKLNSPKFDELPGEDKEDWRSDEVICIALGLEDFFQPKKNFEEGNSSGAKELECTSDFRTPPRKIKSNDKENLVEPIESEEPELQMPQDLIACKKLDELRWQPAPCCISICQELMKGESLQVETLDAYVFFQKTDPSSYKGAQYRALVNKEEWIVMDIFPFLDSSRKDTKKLHVGNHFREKFKKDECAPLLNKKKLIDTGVSISSLIKEVEAANDLNPVTSDEKPHIWDPTNLSRPLNCPFEAGQIVGKQVSCIYNYGMKSWPSQVMQEQGDKSIVADYKGEEQQPAEEQTTSMILTNMRDIDEAFLNKIITDDTLIAAFPYRFCKMSGNFGKNEVLIFDPGAQVQNKKSKGVKNKFTDMISNEVKLEKAVMKVSVGRQLKQWQDTSWSFLAIQNQLKKPYYLQREVFIIKIGSSARLQGQNIQKSSDEIDRIVTEISQQCVNSPRVVRNVILYKYQGLVLGQGRPKVNKSMKLKYHETSRKRVTMYIFDPGGYVRVNEVQLVGRTAGILYDQQLLQEVFIGRELLLKGQEGIVMEVLTEMYVIQVKRSLEVHDPP